MLRGLTEEMKDSASPVGFSIGVAVFADRMPQFGEALQSADGLMYRVKQSSRNSLIYETF